MADTRCSDCPARWPATPSPPVAAQPASSASVEWVPDMAHVANEWADMESNGLQWLRNVRDGISTAEEAIANMEGNLQHCYDTSAKAKAAQPQPQPAQPLTGAGPLSDEQIKAVCRSMLIRPWGIGSRPETAMAFARLIEAAHGITAPSTPTPPGEKS